MWQTSLLSLLWGRRESHFYALDLNVLVLAGKKDTFDRSVLLTYFHCLFEKGHLKLLLGQHLLQPTTPTSSTQRHQYRHNWFLENRTFFTYQAWISQQALKTFCIQSMDSILRRKRFILRRYDICIKECYVRDFLSITHYVMAQTLPFLLFERLAECSNEFIQFLGMTAQEVLNLLDVSQAVVCRHRTQINWQQSNTRIRLL